MLPSNKRERREDLEGALELLREIGGGTDGEKAEIRRLRVELSAWESAAEDVGPAKTPQELRLAIGQARRHTYELEDRLKAAAIQLRKEMVERERIAAEAARKIYDADLRASKRSRPPSKTHTSHTASSREAELETQLEAALQRAERLAAELQQSGQEKPIQPEFEHAESARVRALLEEAETQRIQLEAVESERDVLRARLTVTEGWQEQLEAAERRVIELESRAAKEAGPSEALLEVLQRHVQEGPALREELERLRAENRGLAAVHASERAARREAEELRRMVQRKDDELRRLCMVDGRASELLEEKLRWERLFGESRAFQSPEQLAALLQQSRTDAADQAALAEQRLRELEGLRTLKAAAEATADQARAEARAAEVARAVAGRALKRAESEKRLAESKAAGFAELLATYKELELRMTAHNGSLAEAQSEAEAAKVRMLEEHVSRLEALCEPQEAPEIGELAEWKAQVEFLQAECDKLRQAALLGECQREAEWRRGVRGEFDAENTRVWHLIQNPLAQAAREFGSAEHWRRECATLRAQLDALGSNIHTHNRNSTHLGGSSTAGWEGDGGERVRQLEASLDQTQRELEECRKLRARQVEMFKRVGSQYSEAVHTLFGYRIALSDQHGAMNYRLKSVYRKAASDALEFQQSRDGDFQLLETPFTLQLEPLISEHLLQRGSIPAFLSSLTLQLLLHENE